MPTSKNWWKARATSSVLNALPVVTPSVMPISTAGGGEAQGSGVRCWERAWRGGGGLGGAGSSAGSRLSSSRSSSRLSSSSRLGNVLDKCLQRCCAPLTRVEDDASLHQVDAHNVGGVGLVGVPRLAGDQGGAALAVHSAGDCRDEGWGGVGRGGWVGDGGRRAHRRAHQAARGRAMEEATRQPHSKPPSRSNPSVPLLTAVLAGSPGRRGARLHVRRLAAGVAAAAGAVVGVEAVLAVRVGVGVGSLHVGRCQVGLALVDGGDGAHHRGMVVVQVVVGSLQAIETGEFKGAALREQQAGCGRQRQVAGEGGGGEGRRGSQHSSLLDCIRLQLHSLQAPLRRGAPACGRRVPTPARSPARGRLRCGAGRRGAQGNAGRRPR